MRRHRFKFEHFKAILEQHRGECKEVYGSMQFSLATWSDGPNLSTLEEIRPDDVLVFEGEEYYVFEKQETRCFSYQDEVGFYGLKIIIKTMPARQAPEYSADNPLIVYDDY